VAVTSDLPAYLFESFYLRENLPDVFVNVLQPLLFGSHFEQFLLLSNLETHQMCKTVRLFRYLYFSRQGLLAGQLHKLPEKGNKLVHFQLLFTRVVFHIIKRFYIALQEGFCRIEFFDSESVGTRTDYIHSAVVVLFFNRIEAGNAPDPGYLVFNETAHAKGAFVAQAPGQHIFVSGFKNVKGKFLAGEQYKLKRENGNFFHQSLSVALFSFLCFRQAITVPGVISHQHKGRQAQPGRR
jgi:hypothetical protein